MRPILLLGLVPTLLAARPAPKPPPPPVVEPAPPPGPPPHRATLPAPLAERAFTLPEVHQATLTNGIPVAVVEEHEVPLVFLRFTFRAGAWTDPVGKEGLAAAAMDMLDAGAGDYDAEGLARALKRLGSSLVPSAGPDGSSITVASLSRNLGPTLDLVRTVWTEPTFPADEWSLLQQQYADAIQYRRTDPTSIAWRVLNVAIHGPSYLGRTMDEASLGNIKRRDLKKWTRTWLVPSQVRVFVGGAVSPTEVLAELESRFGSLAGGSPALPARPAAPAPRPAGIITLVDKPGASQSVIVAARYAGQPSDADFAAFQLANQLIGGMFTSRLNLKLREEKGYTYGARTTTAYNLAGTWWTASAPVKAADTVDAMKELVAELGSPAAGEPITEAELDAARGALVHSYPLRFESPGDLLGQLENMWRYGLPEDWIDGYVGRMKAVTVDQAQAAWTSRVDPKALQFVVVGDAASLRGPLGTLGFVVEERDVDGKRLTATP